MKKYRIFLLPLLALLGLVSCERSIEDNPVLLATPEAAVLSMDFDSGSDVVIADEGEERSIKFSFQPANYGANIPAKYTLLVKSGDKEVKLSDVTPEGNTLTLSLVKLNEELIKAGFKPRQEVEASFSLISEPALEAGSPAIKGSTLVSNALTLKLTLAQPAEAIIPDKLFMIGQDFGGWNWESDDVVEMIPVHSHEGMFWTVRYFTNAPEGFR